MRIGFYHKSKAEWLWYRGDKEDQRKAEFNIHL